jgi:hypothetical protein
MTIEQTSTITRRGFLASVGLVSIMQSPRKD